MREIEERRSFALSNSVSPPCLLSSLSLSPPRAPSEERAIDSGVTLVVKTAKTITGMGRRKGGDSRKRKRGGTRKGDDRILFQLKGIALSDGAGRSTPRRTARDGSRQSMREEGIDGRNEPPAPPLRAPHPHRRPKPPGTWKHERVSTAPSNEVQRGNALLVLCDEILHVRLGLGELHLVHALSGVPVKESLAPARVRRGLRTLLPSRRKQNALEHGRELLSNALEELLDGGGLRTRNEVSDVGKTWGSRSEVELGYSRFR